VIGDAPRRVKIRTARVDMALEPFAVVQIQMSATPRHQYFAGFEF
jgi:hypothetical protein